MTALLLFLDQVIISMLIWIIIASAIMSWLLAFNVINYSNQFVRSVWQMIGAITEPMLKPIRRVLPNLGAIDIAPLVLVLLLLLVRYIINIELLPRV